ncbi:hypothetical protein AJ88_44885 [Mesorhizobium amorphae CCBAU 01583]|nr:hypothetical protein AJ88_44885 [Mesorhizobium amorphae CCBAU 01583]
MPTSSNPPFPAALRLFSVAVIIVLIVGAGLFFAPALVNRAGLGPSRRSMPASSAASTPPKWP